VILGSAITFLAVPSTSFKVKSTLDCPLIAPIQNLAAPLTILNRVTLGCTINVPTRVIPPDAIHILNSGNSRSLTFRSRSAACSVFPSPIFMSVLNVIGRSSYLAKLDNGLDGFSRYADSLSATKFYGLWVWTRVWGAASQTNEYNYNKHPHEHCFLSLGFCNKQELDR
jgi:hypothetical protein